MSHINTAKDKFTAQLLSDEGETDELAGEEVRGDFAPEPASEDYRGWPGDGSGEDDLADYNQAEADDYMNE